MEDGTIGFAPHTVSAKSTLFDATLPSSTLSSSKTVVVAQIVTWSIIFLLACGSVAIFYFVMYSKLQDWFPNNEYYVVGCSLGYFFVVLILLVFVVKPLMILVMSASPKHGGIATHDNHKLLNIATVTYLAVALWIYSVLIRSFKAKLAAKENVTVSVEDERTEQTKKLLELLKEVSQSNQIA